MEISHVQNPVSEVIITIRGFDQSMSRLRSDIPPNTVSTLVKSLFNRTLRICLNLNLKPYVITSDVAIQDSMKGQDVETFLDKGISLNQALKSALRTRQANERILFLMPDLPGLTRYSVEKLLHFSQIFENIVVPAIDGGTSALVCDIKTLGQGLFGESSADKFQQLLKEKKKDIAIVRIHELTRDLDTKDDYDYWMNRNSLFADNIRA